MSKLHKKIIILALIATAYGGSLYCQTTSKSTSSYLFKESSDQRARFDPMITGFNLTDVHAGKHIERVLNTFLGVLMGTVEFSIHKEFVSSKIAGEVASLNNAVLDTILNFADKVGLLAILRRYGNPYGKRSEGAGLISTS